MTPIVYNNAAIWYNESNLSKDYYDLKHVLFFCLWADLKNGSVIIFEIKFQNFCNTV